MQRITTLGSLAINLPNAVQPLQPGALPVVLTSFQVITGADGKQAGYVSQMQQQAIAADITDPVLAAVNAQLAYLGLTISRTAAADA